MKRRSVKNRIISVSAMVALVLAMLLFTAGCEMSDIAKIFGSTENANPPATAGSNEKVSSIPSAEASSSVISEAEELIGEEAAKEKALAHAGVSAEKVVFERTELNYDDGRYEYEVDFRVGNAEYDYDIDAITGEVRETDRDHDNDNIIPPVTSSKTEKAENITAEKAKEIALAHAGISADKALYVNSELGRDDGKTVYEIEFFSDGYEYSYEIDAENGNILEFDKDFDD